MKRSTRIVMALAALVTWSAHATEAELHRHETREVTAIWRGSAPDDDFPREMHTETLDFELANGERIAFHPRGQLFMTDWRFDIFSPDDRYVLLLQDRFGPYHVVAVSSLRDYLRGVRSPDYVLGTHDAASGPQVFSGGHWVSPTEIEYTRGDEEDEVIHFAIPQ